VTTTLPPAAAGADDLRHQHAELAGYLAVYVDALLEAAAAPGGPGFLAARTALAGFCGGELLGQAAAEERWLHRAAARSERLQPLIATLVAEHRLLEAMLEELRAADEPARAAAIGSALRVIFDAHIAHEEQLVLPELAAGAWQSPR
jgi:hypothetical protein